MTLKDFYRKLESYNLCIPNLPSTGEMTLGGMICAGTHPTGLKYKPLHSLIREIEFINGSGGTIICSNNNQKNIFKAA